VIPLLPWIARITVDNDARQIERAKPFVYRSRAKLKASVLVVSLCFHNVHDSIADMHGLFSTTQSFANFHVGIPLGIVIGLLASFVQSLGLTIQRKSHVLNGRLPENEQKVEHRRP
jgi:hypothetical protein